MAANDKFCHGQRGQYLGEISALCFIPKSSSLPFLLVGTGSHLLLYDLENGKILKSFYAFEGVRVHGISYDYENSERFSLSSLVEYRIAVFGEKRVKLFILQIDLLSMDKSELILRYLIPKFNHWVMDVCFLKEDETCERNVEKYIAVGLSDNSIFIWNITKSEVVAKVQCVERCLLYSMRLWGNSIRNLQVASGTIYNEIIIWKLVSQGTVHASINLDDGDDYANLLLHDQLYVGFTLSRLIGHEGSIFRIAWSSDGSTLISASDDRSSRIWVVGAVLEAFSSRQEVLCNVISESLVLFGHTARIWDCCISDSLFVTVGEDCSCRVWGTSGNQLKIIKDHSGRGIWRCLYEPHASLLITAGFDSAIKVHQLHMSSLIDTTGDNHGVREFDDMTQIFTISPTNLSTQLGMMDSKSEYVRCLHFARENILYVATNHGYIYHVELSDPGDVKWTVLFQVSDKVSIICMDILSTSHFEHVEDWIAVGDGKGNATVTKIFRGFSMPRVAHSFHWSAEKERQLLGIHWCKSLGYRYIFTTDPRGGLKLWSMNHEAFLLKQFFSCFGIRIMCLDASFEEEVLACGDQRGNLLLFPLSKSLLLSTSTEPEDSSTTQNCYFKGAHGISSIASVLLARWNQDVLHINSTGGDGCICYFKFDTSQQTLEFVGMKQVKELSLVQSVFSNSKLVDMEDINYALGFASSTFIIWNFSDEMKILRVPCGGWRRPYSYFLGDVPEIQHCFAYLKDHTIHVHRLWLSDRARRLFPIVLHVKYHGREIHSLRFISVGMDKDPNNYNHQPISWITTGCEDGTVRLTRYDPMVVGNWSESKLLGEHVGGSAVKSIYFASKTYLYNRDQPCAPFSSTVDQLLLISVGAKQVLTTWVLQNRKFDKNEQTLVNHRENSSVSFQWFSTHMPSRLSSISKKLENTVRSKQRDHNVNHIENDWRYLAVTAFLVQHARSRLTVCFIVVACSDATLTLRALVLPTRKWYDVASLIPQNCPVLSLQHVVIPIPNLFEDQLQVRNAYIVISGSTDGSITFWDLTEIVEVFMQGFSGFQLENLIDFQKRPRTGRGSQGGRWWKTLNTTLSNNDTKNDNEVIDSNKIRNSITIEKTNDIAADIKKCKFPDSSENFLPDSEINSFPVLHAHRSISKGKAVEIHPFHVLSAVHQSGVNCLHISKMEMYELHSSENTYCILSGGDDQSLVCLGFDLSLVLEDSNSEVCHCSHITDHIPNLSKHQSCELRVVKKCFVFGEIEGFRLKFLYQHSFPSAHSSAVKGVWTDGIWAFTAGLDQRVRFWHHNRDGKLIEHSHLILSVPEPEALDAKVCSRNNYQIAVVGRGMQMIEFVAPNNGNLEKEL